MEIVLVCQELSIDSVFLSALRMCCPEPLASLVSQTAAANLTEDPLCMAASLWLLSRFSVFGFQMCLGVNFYEFILLGFVELLEILLTFLAVAFL